MHGVALLLGILGAPLLLVALGHHLRRRSARSKRIFWGGVIGHSIGIAITMIAMLTPPVSWTAGGPMRTVWVHWSMLGGLFLGIAVASVFRGQSKPSDG
jgi:hypothetical protein